MLNSIQALRAAAAWLVVLHHYMQVAHNFSLTDPFSMAISKYGAIGVDLFFVISGFVIYLSTTGKNLSPGVFAAHRLARIAPAYWVFTVITAGVIILEPGLIPSTLYDPVFMIKSLLFIPDQNPSGLGIFPILTMGWTLNYEMAFYAIFCAALFLPKNLQLAAIFIGIILMKFALPPIADDFVFYKSTITYEFLFGILIAICYKRGLLNKPSFVITAAIALIFSALFRLWIGAPINHDPFGAGFICSAVFIVAVSQERLFSKIGIVGKLGDWSYSTYLSHVLVICYMMKLQHALSLGTWTTLGLIALCVILVSWVSFTLIEKPIARFAKRRLKRPPAIAPAL